MLSKLLFATARALKPGSSATLDDVLRYFRGPACMRQPSPFILKAGVKGEQRSFSGSKGVYLKPKRAAGSSIILYIHGGAYVGGPFINEWEFLSYIADYLSIRAYLPAYPLAPEYPYPVAFNQMFDLYNTLSHKYEKIILIGSSAGGGLALSLLNKIVEEKKIIPAAACLISPWVQIKQGQLKAKPLDGKDVFLNRRILSLAASAYANSETLTNPIISPIYGKNSGLPPCYLSAGSDELFADDIKNLESQLKEKSCIVEYKEGKNQPHIWPTFFLIPEAKLEVRRICDFLLGHLNG